MEHTGLQGNRGGRKKREEKRKCKNKEIPNLFPDQV